MLIFLNENKHSNDSSKSKGYAVRYSNKEGWNYLSLHLNLKEIVSVRDQFQQNALYQKIFHLEPWLSKDQLADVTYLMTYAGYKHIDNFYKKLKERDSDL
jgi:hypothetical protein